MRVFIKIKNNNIHNNQLTTSTYR